MPNAWPKHHITSRNILSDSALIYPDIVYANQQYSGLPLIFNPDMQSRRYAHWPDDRDVLGNMIYTTELDDNLYERARSRMWVVKDPMMLHIYILQCADSTSIILSRRRLRSS